MDFRITSKETPNGFKSSALKAALKNLGQIPTLLGKIGDGVTREIYKNLGGRILHRRSGRLQDSWEWAISANAKGWELVIESDVVYARIHNFGGMTGRGHKTKIPKRRYVDKAVIAKKALVKQLTRDFLSKVWRG